MGIWYLLWRKRSIRKGLKSFDPIGSPIGIRSPPKHIRVMELVHMTRRIGNDSLWIQWAGLLLTTLPLRHTKNQRQLPVRQQRSRRRLQRRRLQPLPQLMLLLIVKLIMAVVRIIATRLQLIANVQHVGR